MTSVEVPADPTMSRADAATLHRQLLVAARAACNLLDTQSAERAGYYLGSPNVEGVGTHWINWSLVNRPFDPARQSRDGAVAAGDIGHGEAALADFQPDRDPRSRQSTRRTRPSASSRPRIR